MQFGRNVYSLLWSHSEQFQALTAFLRPRKQKQWKMSKKQTTKKNPTFSGKLWLRAVFDMNEFLGARNSTTNSTHRVEGFFCFFFNPSFFHVFLPPNQSNMLIWEDAEVSFKSHRIACKVYFLQWRQKTSITDIGLVWLSVRHGTSPRKKEKKKRHKTTTRNKKL